MGIAITFFIYNEITFSIFIGLFIIYFLYQFNYFRNKSKNRKVIIMLDKLILYSDANTKYTKGVNGVQYYSYDDIVQFKKELVPTPKFRGNLYGLFFATKYNSKIWLGDFENKGFVELLINWLNKHLRLNKDRT